MTTIRAEMSSLTSNSRRISLVSPLLVLSQLALQPFLLVQRLLTLARFVLVRLFKTNNSVLLQVSLLCNLLLRRNAVLLQVSLLYNLLLHRNAALLQNHLAKFSLQSNHFLARLALDKCLTKMLPWTYLKLTASTEMSMTVSTMTRIITANKTFLNRLTTTAILNTSSSPMIQSIGAAIRAKITCFL